MKTKTLKKNKINVVTLGCSKNTFDSEVMMAQLKANKFDVTHESTEDDAEVVIIIHVALLIMQNRNQLIPLFAMQKPKRMGM